MRLWRMYDTSPDRYTFWLDGHSISFRAPLPFQVHEDASDKRLFYAEEGDIRANCEACI